MVDESLWCVTSKPGWAVSIGQAAAPAPPGCAECNVSKLMSCAPVQYGLGWDSVQVGNWDVLLAG